MNRLYKSQRKQKLGPKGPAEQYWEEFTNLAILKGYTIKISGDLAYMNKKGKQFKLISTIGGILKVYDETINQQYDVYRKVV